VNIEFLESDSGEDGMHQHLDVAADEDVRHDQDAVEAAPFFLRNLDFLLHQVHQQVLQVRDAFLLLLLTLDVQTAVSDDLSWEMGTLRKM